MREQICSRYLSRQLKKNQEKYHLLQGIFYTELIPMEKEGGDSPRSSDFFILFSRVHMVEHPVPDDKHAGNDHVGQQSCTEECEADLYFSLHRAHL